MPIFPQYKLLSQLNNNTLLENINTKDEALQKIDKLIKLVSQAEEKNNYDEAIYLLEEILKIEKKFFGEKSNYVANTLNWIGKIYLFADKNDLAKKPLNESFLIKKDLHGEENIELLEVFNNLGYLFYKKRKYKKAENQFLKALKIIERLEQIDNAEQIDTFYFLGLTYNKMGFFDKANNFLQSTLKFEKKLYGEDHINLSETYFEIGENYNEAGNFKKSETNFMKAFNIEKQKLGIDHESTATTLNALGENYLELGMYEKAKSYISKSLTIREKLLGKNHEDVATSLNDLALYYWYTGKQLNKAEPLLLRALSIRKNIYGEDNPYTAVIHSNLGLIYSGLRQYKKALKNNQIALEMRKNYYGKNHFKTISSRNNLAMNYIDLERYEEAEKILEEILIQSREIYGENNSLFAFSLHNLGGFYTQINRNDKAKNLLKKSININKKILPPNHPMTGNSLRVLAGIYENEGLYKKAKLFLEESLRIHKNAYGDNSYELKQLNDLAYINLFLEDYSQSMNQFRKFLINELIYIQEELPLMSLREREELVKSISIYNPGTLYSKFKNKEGKELALFARLNSQGLIQEIESKQHKFISKINKNDKSFINLKKINTKISSLDISDFERKSLRKQKEILEKKLYRKLPELEPKIIDISSVVNVMPDQSLLIEFQSYYPYENEDFFGIGINYKNKSNKGFIIEKIFDGSPAEKAGIKNKDIILSVNKIDTTGKFKEKAENLLTKSEKLELVIQRKNNILLKTIIKSKFNIGWQWKDERYMAITLNSRGEINIFDLGLSERINKKISNAVFSTEQSLADAQYLWDELRQIIFKPLEYELKKSKTLFISPDSEFNRIPFAALRNSRNSKYLSEEYNLRLLTTGREILKLSEKSDLNKNKSLVIANPRFDLEQNLEKDKNYFSLNNTQKRSIDLKSYNWGNLPATKKEGEFIANLIDADLLTDEKATVIAIQNSISPKILHIASHAFYLPNQEKKISIKKNKNLNIFKLDNPLLRSGIVLAGANQTKVNPIDDGYLTSLEASKLDLNKTELIVISGCESGKGDIMSGEGVYGLKRALAVAGARSSLLSLWKVNDQATAAFMESFYTKLLNKQDRASALALTQKEFRNHPVEAWRHPNVWAAFQLSGDWRPIDF